MYERELFKAIEDNDINKVKNFVIYVTDINAKYNIWSLHDRVFEIDDMLGKTALVCASEKGYLEIVKCLVEHGTDINDEDCGGLSALTTAVMYNHLEIVKYFIEEKGMNINHKGSKSWTILMAASVNGHLNIVKYLVEHGADINSKKDNGGTVLMEASCGRGDLENLKVIKYLVEEKGMDINVKDNEGWTTLMYAINKENWEIVKYLIEHGADVNAKDKNGNTALILAIDTYRIAVSYSFYSGRELDYIETIKFLIYNGANVNIKNKIGETPLSLSKGYPILTKLLKDKRRADFNIKDNEGWTSLMHASRNRHLEVVKYLLEKGADIDAKYYGDLIVVQYLMEKGAKYINAKSKEGWTTLMYASYIGDFETVKYLIENGADVNAKNNIGWTYLTYLQYASFTGNDEIIEEIRKILLDAGAK